jgi:hypothetical protein
MITIAMLVGMGKMDELKLHFRATRNTGVSRDEVKELLMHAAIYCGVPAAFRRIPAGGADLRRDGQGRERMKISLASLGAEPGRALPRADQARRAAGLSRLLPQRQEMGARRVRAPGRRDSGDHPESGSAPA